jgi:hypothetical protein
MIPLDAAPDLSLMEEAIALIKGGLGKAEIEFPASVTAPLFWVLRDHSGERIKNGSVLFLDAGMGVFAVTAAHVVEECFADSKLPTFVQSMIGGNGMTLPLHLADRIIAAHHDLDIATFHVTPKEVQLTGHTVLTGFQKSWPPSLPEVERGITYCGYPGNGRRILAPRDICFGCVAAGGIATSVNENSISILIERANLIPALGKGVLPENYDFGGVSGGPLIAIVQTPTIRSWMPASVIIQGPNPTGDASQSIQGFEMIKARPVHFIMPDGHLDVPRWEMNNIHHGR